MPRDPLTELWAEILMDLGGGHVTQAYNKVLESGDDIYLLRLMHRTGVVFLQLDPKIRNKVLSRLCGVMESGFLESLGVSWFGEALKTKETGLMNKGEKQSMMEALYKISSQPTEEGVRAAQLYSSMYDTMSNR